MIRNACILLVGLLAALFALKAFVSLRARRAAPAAPAAQGAPAEALAGNALHVHYQPWQPFAGHDPISGRDGFCLDVIRRIFPGATLGYDEHPTDAALFAHVADSADCALVTLGKHPDLAGFPQSKTPIAHYAITIVSPRASRWAYRGPESLEGIRLGYSRSYLEAPLVAEHWARHRDDPGRVLLFPDDSEVRDWLPRALAGECDAIVLTLAAARWAADNSNLVLRDDFRDAGAVQMVPLYLTLSPKDPAFAAAVLEEFERGMARLEADGTLARLRAFYFPLGEAR